MPRAALPRLPMAVALRKESVDRNLLGMLLYETIEIRSLSARRAWIEIPALCMDARVFRVALRKESVDRNRRHEDGSLRLDVALRKEKSLIHIS